MPVNEKILFGSFPFSLKTIIYAILSSAMLRENHAVFLGKNIDFRGGGGINIHFRPKYRPLVSGVGRWGEGVKRVELRKKLPSV